MPNFTDRLKQLRVQNNITQKGLAGILNVSQNAVYNWENGKCEPSIEMLKKIANYFNVSLDYLMGESIHTPKQNKSNNNYYNSAENNNQDLINLVNVFSSVGGISEGLHGDLSSLITCYNDELNDLGKKEALKRIKELAQIKKYIEDIQNKSENNN